MSANRNKKVKRGAVSMGVCMFLRIIVAAFLVVPSLLYGAEGVVLQGVGAYKKGDYDLAIACYNRAIELDPKDALAYGNRGNARKAKGDLEGAIDDYSRAIELNPKLAAAHNNRGYAKQTKGDLAGAITDYNRAIELEPKYTLAYSNRGKAKILTRNWTDALADYKNSCELSERGQDYPRLFIWLIRSRLGETEAASKELSAYLDKRPNAAPNDWISNIAGHLLGKVEEPSLFAAAASPDAKKEIGQQCEAWFYTGMKKLLAGDKAAAADCFRKCLATEQKRFTEYMFAEAELRALTP